MSLDDDFSRDLDSLQSDSYVEPELSEAEQKKKSEAIKVIINKLLTRNNSESKDIRNSNFLDALQSIPRPLYPRRWRITKIVILSLLVVFPLVTLGMLDRERYSLTADTYDFLSTIVFWFWLLAPFAAIFIFPLFKWRFRHKRYYIVNNLLRKFVDTIEVSTWLGAFRHDRRSAARVIDKGITSEEEFTEKNLSDALSNTIIPPSFEVGYTQFIIEPMIINRDGKKIVVYETVTNIHNFEYFLSIACVELETDIPQFYLDGGSGGKRFGQFSDKYILKLEGDFNEFFNLYVSDESGSDSLRFLTPDVMQRLMKSGAKFDIEGSQKRLFVISDRSFLEKEQFEDLDYLLDNIEVKLDRLKNGDKSFTQLQHLVVSKRLKYGHLIFTPLYVIAAALLVLLSLLVVFYVLYP